MLMTLLKNAGKVFLLAVISTSYATAQSVNIKGAKGTTAIPKACESVVPAKKEGQVEINGLVKEANCKGSGDMLSEHTYILKSLKRQKKNGQIKEESVVYEVFMPTLPNGARGSGVLLVTSRDGVPVPPDELEKERLRVGERLEKEEKKVSSIPVSQSQSTANPITGMLPLGTYARFVFGGGKAVLNIHTFLTSCDFTLVRREQNAGREMLVLTYTAQPDAQLKDNEKYIAQLTGAIWIDAQDRIVTRLIGWPRTENVATAQDPPAVSFEMTRLPSGIWLPLEAHLNGSNYPGLFDRFANFSTLTYSEYKRFTTEIKDLTLEAPPSAR